MKYIPRTLFSISILIAIFCFILGTQSSVYSYLGGSCEAKPGPPARCDEVCSLGVDYSGGSCNAAEPPYLASTQTGNCNGCIRFNSDTNKYEYHDWRSFKNGYPLCYGQILDYNTIESDDRLSTDIVGCMWTGSAPSGCNQGFTCEGGVGGGGGGGSCPGSGIGSECPQLWKDHPCGNIPCAYREACGCVCSCDGACSMEGGQCVDVPGGGATPTPTPTPYCTVSCLGASGQQGGSGQGGGLDVVGGGQGSAPAPTVMPPLITGTINYSGYNNFSCGTFKDGKWYNGPCPTPPGGQTAGSGSGSGLGETDSWSHSTKYNMLCGGNNFTYTAQVEATTQSGGGQSGGQISPTLPGGGGGGPTPALYPQGCQVGVTPTPTLPGGVQGGGGDGTQGGTTSSSSCSCSITLSCQSQLYDSPNSTACSATCNFSVSPDYPLFNQTTTFQTTQSTPSTNITFSFDDGSATVSNQQTVTHTFVNAGVYDVALSCSATSETCTRRVNAYCNNGVVPSPTPTPTPTPGPWYKVKDADFVRKTEINNKIPSSVTAYDADDTGSPDCSGQVGGADIRCLNLNQPGLITSNGTVDVGAAPLSSRAWKLENYTIKRQIDASSFVDYVASRKKPKTITSIDQIQKGYINIINDDLTISDNAIVSETPFVLIVKGNLTIDTKGAFGTRGNGAAYVATGTLNITAQTQELNGIFIATNVDIASDISSGSTTQTPLKIIGNISSTNPTTTLGKRVPSDLGSPAFFTVLDFAPFKEVLPFLSVRTYEWEELTP